MKIIRNNEKTSTNQTLKKSGDLMTSSAALTLNDPSLNVSLKNNNQLFPETLKSPRDLFALLIKILSAQHFMLNEDGKLIYDSGITVDKEEDIYSLRSNGCTFKVEFGKEYKIYIPSSYGLKLIRYYLQYPESEENLTEVRKKLGLKYSDDGFDSSVKNIKDTISSLKEIECNDPSIKSLSDEDKFSYYISELIIFDYSNRKFSINKFMLKDWKFD